MLTPAGYFVCDSGFPQARRWLQNETMLSCRRQHISIQGRKRQGHMHISGSGITWRDSDNFWRNKEKEGESETGGSNHIRSIMLLSHHLPLTSPVKASSPGDDLTLGYVGAWQEMNVGPWTHRRWGERTAVFIIIIWKRSLSDPNFWICVLKLPSIFIYSN